MALPYATQLTRLHCELFCASLCSRSEELKIFAKDGGGETAHEKELLPGKTSGSPPPADLCGKGGNLPCERLADWMLAF